MKVVLFCNERTSITLSTASAIDMMLWLPQRYEYNHKIYLNLKAAIAKSENDIVILNDECFNTQKFRTNPSFIDAIVKWKEVDYKIADVDCEYFKIENFKSPNEYVSTPDLSGFEKSHIQEIDTYFW